MKYLQYLLLVLIAAGCETKVEYEWVFRNDTGHNIKIEAFFKGSRKNESIYIKPYDEYIRIKDREIHEPSLFDNYQVDSVTIKFNNKRLIIQSCDENLLISCQNVEKNICRNQYSYIIEDTGEHSSRFTYIITEEDYNNAIPIQP